MIEVKENAVAATTIRNQVEEYLKENIFAIDGEPEFSIYVLSDGETRICHGNSYPDPYDENYQYCCIGESIEVDMAEAPTEWDGDCFDWTEVEDAEILSQLADEVRVDLTNWDGVYHHSMDDIHYYFSSFDKKWYTCEFSPSGYFSIADHEEYERFVSEHMPDVGFFDDEEE